MAEFDAKHRNLEDFLTWLRKSKEGSKEDGTKDEVQELDSGKVQIEIKKENVPVNKQRLGSEQRSAS